MAAAILSFTALFIGLDIAERPIALWDESRLAVNALEMRQRGFSLVTTYGFAPDLWNTKPPLSDLAAGRRDRPVRRAGMGDPAPVVARGRRDSRVDAQVRLAAERVAVRHGDRRARARGQRGF